MPDYLQTMLKLQVSITVSNPFSGCKSSRSCTWDSQPSCDPAFAKDQLVSGLAPCLFLSLDICLDVEVLVVTPL